MQKAPKSALRGGLTTAQLKDMQRWAYELSGKFTLDGLARMAATGDGKAKNRQFGWWGLVVRGYAGGVKPVLTDYNAIKSVYNTMRAYDDITTQDAKDAIELMEAVAKVQAVASRIIRRNARLSGSKE